MPKQERPKNPSRKFVLIEVETTWTNAELRLHGYEMFEDHNCTPVQVTVNAAKKERTK